MAAQATVCLHSKAGIALLEVHLLYVSQSMEMDWLLGMRNVMIVIKYQEMDAVTLSWLKLGTLVLVNLQFVWRTLQITL